MSSCPILFSLAIPVDVSMKDGPQCGHGSKLLR